MKRTADVWNGVGNEEIRPAESAWPQKRTGTLTVRVELQGNGPAALWLPYAVSDHYQRITDVTVSGNYAHSAVYADEANSTTMLHAAWADCKGATLTLACKVERRRIVTKFNDIKIEPAWNSGDYAEYLSATSLGPVDGNVKKTADLIVKDLSTVHDKARAVYRWVIENTYRDNGIVGCGDGDVCAMLAKKGDSAVAGKCTDIGSLFVALCRAAGVPAREVFGIRLAKTFDKTDVSKWQHCWCEIFLPGQGWIPCDPADVRLKMLTENLPLHGSKK